MFGLFGTSVVMTASHSAHGLPLVSIIVRTVNRGSYLRDCLRSLAFQDYPNLEVVIVNDGGPSLRGLIESLPFKLRSKVVELAHNTGRSFAGNCGLEQATGEYLGFLDDDDIFYPFHISSLMSALLERNHLVVYSDAYRAEQIRAPFDDTQYITTRHSVVYSRDFDFTKLLQGNYIPILCALFSRECLAYGARFDPLLEVLEDWDFWLQLAPRFQFHHLHEITSEYRVRKDGTNTQGTHEELWKWSRDYIRKKHGGIRRAISPTGFPNRTRQKYSDEVRA